MYKRQELGSGMSAKAFEYFDEILQTTFDKVRNCECEWGCPLCIAPKFCKERLIVMSKPAALLILASLLGYDLNEFQEQVQDGPEQNMPVITIETIESGPSTVKFSKDVEIISVRKARHPLNPKVEVKEAVSYTHLDVYKRQTHGHLLPYVYDHHTLYSYFGKSG